MRVVLAAASVMALAPTSVFAVDYMTPEQAMKLMFPQADRFESREVVLDAAQLQKLNAQGVRARSARWTARLAWHGNEPLGVVVVDDVIGKFELITYAVGLGVDGTVKQVEVLSYRESHGHEIRLPAWRKQFVGKTAESAMKVGEDIANISGATLSCTHVTDGVRRITALVDLARRGGQLK
jgi:Na+-translocating ferredoxin:NAD+ oxidoreductase RnfG subunit